MKPRNSTTISIFQPSPNWPVDPDWGAGVKLQQAKIAFAHANYEVTRNLLREVAPVFTRPNSEVYSQREYKTLPARLDRVANR